LLVAAWGVGAIGGSLVMVTAGDRLRRSTFTLLGFILFVVGLTMFGLAPAYGVAIAGVVAIGTRSDARVTAGRAERDNSTTGVIELHRLRTPIVRSWAP